MDDAWWGASIPTPDCEASFILAERSMPCGVIVDQQGYRCVNESASYIEVGHAILERNKELVETGTVVEATTVDELAEAIDIEPEVLGATIGPATVFSYVAGRHAATRDAGDQ